MEFKSLNNLESSFKRVRFLAMIFSVLCAVIVIFTIISSYVFTENQRKKIYVLDQGKSLILALQQDMSQNRPAEAKDHILRFHELFFTLAPQKSLIEENINRALSLSDKSAYKYYVDLSEKGYYSRIISTNSHQYIKIDSIQCDFDSYPYYATTYARQVIVRESVITERNLVTTCSLINTSRSDENPHGFTLERFTIKDNSDIQHYKR